MINRDLYREFLKQNMYGATVQAGGDEVVCKCKYCPDDGDHYHMNISIPKTEADLSFFNCWKCHTSGVVTYKKLLEWGLYDQGLFTELTTHNTVASTKSMAAMSDLQSSTVIRPLMVYNTPCAQNDIKLEYINERLGIGLNYHTANASNIILNVGELLYNNRLQNSTRDPRIFKDLSDYFVGFLSYDASYVNLRRIVPEGNLYRTVDKKYINYNIYGKKDNTRKFYSIPSCVDITKPIQIRIAEGPFDILSVKYNLVGEEPNNCFFAVTGNEYLSLLRFLICGKGLINIVLHFYLDNDAAGNYTWRSILDFLSGFPHIPIYVHKNAIGKDMGVSKDQIEEVIERIR